MITRRKFVKNLSTGLFVPSVLLARKSRAASGMIVDPYKIIRPTHAGATAWAAQVVTNGGASPSAASIRVVSDAFYSIDAQGWSHSVAGSDIKFLNLFAPDSLIASITPQIDVSAVPWTNNNFVVGDLTVNGLKGNGTNKSLGTGYLPATYWVDGSAGLSCMVSLAAAENTYDMGIAGNNLNSQFGLQANWSDTKSYFECFRFDAPNFITGTPPASPTVGYWSGNRTSTSAGTMYFAKTGTAHGSIGTMAGAQTGAANMGGVFTLYIFALNSTGTIGSWSTKRLSMVAGHKGFSSAESSAFFTLCQAARTAFGGGTV